MHQRTLIVGIVLVGLVIGVIFVVRSASVPGTTPQAQRVSPPRESSFVVGKKAPDFTLKDFDGNEVFLASFYGKKAVVLDFWAAWCPFCVSEMPELEKAQNAYADKLVMIGVHRTDSNESIATGKKFADEQGVTYLLLQGTSAIYRASTKGLQGMPVAVFIDKNGVVQEVKVGPKTESEIKEKVDRLFQ